MSPTLLLLFAVGLLHIGQGLVAPEEGSSLRFAVKTESRPTCRAALSECIKNLDNHKIKQCEILPVPPRSFLKQITPGTFELRKLRSYVWMYNDGLYLSIIVLKDRRLVLIDFPDTLGSNTVTGSGTLLTDAIDKVLGNTTPKRIDMVYSHAHFDHIGAATRVFKYTSQRFTKARFFVWGSRETKELINVHKTNRAVKVTKVIGKKGRTLKMGRDLKINLAVVGGHTQEDLLIRMPKTSKDKGILFYADTVFPGWSMVYNLALTQDVRELIQAHEDVLRLDFDILVPGHLRAGTKKDVRINLTYLKDLMKASARAIDTVTPKQLAEAGIWKIKDPKAREYRNSFYSFLLPRELQIDACYRIMIEKWGCRLAGLDLVLRGHCFTSIIFTLTDI